MRTEFILKTFTDDHFINKLDFLSVLEAAWGDYRNELPETLRVFDGDDSVDTFPLGKGIRVVFEVINEQTQTSQ